MKNACALFVAALLAACGTAPEPQTPRPGRGRGDFDRDGLVDATDQCPAVPEDLDDEEDADGCPEAYCGDRDQDGVEEPGDACPDDAEDRDGDADEDGCPDPPSTI